MGRELQPQDDVWHVKKTGPGSFAAHLLENGASVKDIQTMMGHADISSTQVYVQLLDSHVKQVYNDCHPKAKLG